MDQDDFIRKIGIEHELTVAMLYSQAIQSKAEYDWGKINRAIIDRWSKTKLEKIKELAWQMVGGG